MHPAAFVIADRRKLCYTDFAALAARHCTYGRRLAYTSRKGGEAMRITFHIGEFTITIIVKKR